MIDAALAAAIAAPVAPSGEPAPAEGFGDLLSQMLGTAAQPAGADAQEAAEALDALAAAHAAAQAAATVAGVVLTTDANPGKSGAGAAEDVVTESTGKAASSAWHASPAARAHASAHSAVVLAAAAQAATEAARQGAGQDTAVMTESAAADAPVQATEMTAQAAVAAAGAADAIDALLVSAEAAEAALVATEAQDGASQDGASQDRASQDGAAQAHAAQDGAAQTHAAQDGPRAASGAPRVQAGDDIAAGGVDVTAAEHAPPVKAADVPARGARRVEPVAAPAGVDGGATRAADQAGHAGDVRPAGPPTELFASGALRRVMEAIEAAEHRPPPNTMAVEIPGEGAEGALRLMVSVRGSVVEITSQGDRVLPPGWARPLAEALAERGMSLDGFGGQDAAGRQDGAAADRDGRAARDERDERAAARRAGVTAPAAPGTAQLSSTGHDGALRL